MKVYIASKYLKHKDINQKIYDKLIAEKINVFLPMSINVDAITPAEMKNVSEICYTEIEKCNIIIIVAPFGKSVSSEIGYAIALKRSDATKKLILYNAIQQEDPLLKNEAMIIPYIDAEINDLTTLIDYIKNIS